MCDSSSACHTLGRHVGADSRYLLAAPQQMLVPQCHTIKQGRQGRGLSHLRLQHLAGVQVAVFRHVLVHQLVRDADDVQPGTNSGQRISGDANQSNVSSCNVLCL